MKNLQKVKPGQPISARAYNDLIDAINEMRIVASADILPKQQAGGQSLFIRPTNAAGRKGSSTAIPARITGHTLAISGEWLYTWEQAREGGLTTGTDTYVVDTPPAATGEAYNYAEYRFYSIDGYRDFTPVPVETGALVWLTAVGTQWWFDRDVNTEMGDAPSGTITIMTSAAAVSANTSGWAYNEPTQLGTGTTWGFVSHIAYDPVNHKFIQYVAEAEYDAGGRLVRRSGETPVNVTSLVSCSGTT